MVLITTWLLVREILLINKWKFDTGRVCEEGE